MPVANPDSTPDPGPAGGPGASAVPPFPADLDEPCDSATFVTAVLDLIRTVRRMGGFARAVGDPAISLSQLVVLSAVGTAGSRGISAIAEEAGLAQPSVTRTLDALHRRGLVRRDRHPGDGRSTQVALTEEGARLLGDKTVEVHRRLTNVWYELPPDSRRQVLTLLPLLAKAVESLG
ncbi:MarR family transcriptional regulator [Thermopolyspora sp. NPDC052614]|uniref:MarR family winged helix-turn-helix transcriptional regulator n=1 Tax=Thermopolyspora sp. NPDC052614 TaxID=3155682 RepID=UPI00342A9DAD